VLKMRHIVTALLLIVASAVLIAQDDTRVEFDVVSIKRHDPNDFSGAMRRFPDGTFTMTGMPIASIISSASPTPTRDVEGLPTWAKSERYDVTAKPPSNSTRDQIGQMWRAMFADRMKLSAHVEEHEQNTFALMLARSDGRLGPHLKPSTLDCSPPTPGAPPPPPPPAASSPDDYKTRCGGMFGQGLIVSGWTTMDRLVFSLKGLAGGEVIDRTGLTGGYAVELRFAPPRSGAVPDAVVAADEPPEFLTALREQLGLKLVPQKSKVPVLVIDHIERPSEN
jgi:uncharacterized protein (TIGR03435 family)